MTRVSIVGNHQAEPDSDFYIRTVVAGTGTESKMSVDFGALAPDVSAADMDLASIATGFFELEGLFRDGVIGLGGELEIVLCQNGLRTKNVTSALEDLLSFTLRRRPDVKPFPSRKQCADGPGRSGATMHSICLFSGGIDSLSGILSLPRNLSPTAGVYVSQSGNIWRLVQRLQAGVLKEKSIPIYKIGIQHSHSGLQQMRGFAYLIMGAIVAKMFGTDNVAISETGQTMFLPPLASLDEVTLTTHPTLVEITKRLLHECYQTKLNIFEPFSNLTKAEVAALCGAKDAIPATNSCFNTRFANQTYSHCGRCYGCLVRRVGCLVAGVKDAEYSKDVITKKVGDRVMGGWPGRTIQTTDLADLQALLRFSRDVLDDKLDESTRFKIDSFSKGELYHRAALDVLSALYLLYGKTKEGRNEWVRGFFEECKVDGLVSAEIAENRIADVRNQKHKADFNTVL